MSTSSSLCTAENTLAPLVTDVTGGTDAVKPQAAPRSTQGKSFIPDPGTSQKEGGNGLPLCLAWMQVIKVVER